ncbi:MAG: ABC transporter permease subunit [Firmicutes bacterium]|nr:ABC transporter permease subunit [Bacillota bacterium]
MSKSSICSNQLALYTKPKSNALQSAVQYIKKNFWLYLLLIPGVAYFLIFHYAPMYGILIAFKDFDVVKGVWNSSWIGLDNFTYLFKSKDFFNILSNSIIISFYRLFFGFPAPIILAILLNEVRSNTYKRTIQTILYLPHFISWVVITGIIYVFLSPSTGVVNLMINEFGGKSIAFLQEPKYFRSIIVLSGIWKETGWGTIVYLSAITSIDVEQYEAAFIDGANRLQTILYITLPSIMSTIVVLLILRMGNILRNGFEQIFLLYNPMVYNVADVFETYSYRVGILEGRFSYSTAVGIFQSVVGLIFIMSSNYLSRKVNDAGLW